MRDIGAEKPCYRKQIQLHNLRQAGQDKAEVDCAYFECNFEATLLNVKSCAPSLYGVQSM